MSAVLQHQEQESPSPTKRHKLSHHSTSHFQSLLPPLDSFPLSLSKIASPVADLLTSTAVTLTKASADAARESTFDYLQDEDAVVVALYTPVYAAAQLFYAQGCYREAVDLMPTLLTSLAAEEGDQGTGADLMSPPQQQETDQLRTQIVECLDACLRAVDLAVLRTSVGVWTQIAKPLLQTAETLRSSSALLLRGDRVPADESEGEGARQDPPSTHSATTTSSSCYPTQFFNNPFEQERGSDIPRVDASSMSMETFLTEYMDHSRCPPSPVILCHAISSWPALKKWSSLEYLKGKAAGRLVPVGGGWVAGSLHMTSLDMT